MVQIELYGIPTEGYKNPRVNYFCESYRRDFDEKRDNREKVILSFIGLRGKATYSELVRATGVWGKVLVNYCKALIYDKKLIISDSRYKLGEAPKFEGLSTVFIQTEYAYGGCPGCGETIRGFARDFKELMEERVCEKCGTKTRLLLFEKKEINRRSSRRYVTKLIGGFANKEKIRESIIWIAEERNFSLREVIEILYRR